jgi:hypothetical protein
MRLLLVIVLLTGCATQTREQHAARMVAKASPYCEAIGYQKNSDPWKECVLSVMKTMAVQPRSRGPVGCQQLPNGAMACY